jgi:predicted solute-binding protein
MSRVVRLGAVDYLNVRPLVFGLGQRSDLSLRFDVPSVCARLLAEGAIDLGMVPSVTYLDRPGDRIVPGVCIGSVGPVASVALFTKVPVRQVRSVALDTSSRTSAALVRILCRHAFDISPTFVPHEPALPAMLAKADAALLIGDPALFLDPAAFAVEKIDLGQVWSEMTGLPFVWAFWAGRAEATEGTDVVSILHDAAARGAESIASIAASYCADVPSRIPIAEQYLRDNLEFRLSTHAIRGLEAYLHEAVAAGVAPANRRLEFFPSAERERAVPPEATIS